MKKKLVLIVVDGMTPEAFERAADGRAPALAFLAAHGDYRRGTSVFPSLTPVCLSSIATGGGPDGATQTLVYKVFQDGKAGTDLGGSAAQSVILMIIVVALTAFQFRYVEKNVHY